MFLYAWLITHFVREERGSLFVTNDEGNFIALVFTTWYEITETKKEHEML